MDSLGTVAFGAACASLGSLVTGYLLKAADRRREMRDAGPLVVERKRHLDLYEAVRLLSGKLAELRHCVDHVRRDTNAALVERYATKGDRLRLEIRESARSEILGIGPEVVLALTQLTDHAEVIFSAARAKNADVGSSVLIKEQLRAKAHEWHHEIEEVQELIGRLQREHEAQGRW